MQLYKVYIFSGKILTNAYYMLYNVCSSKGLTAETENLKEVFIMKKLKKMIAGALAVAVSAVCMMPFAVLASEIDKDPNGDGDFDIADATYILLYLRGNIQPADITQLDINNNGIVSQLDLDMIYLYEAGVEI